MRSEPSDSDAARARSRLERFIDDLNGLNGVVPLGNFVYSVHVSLKHRYIYVETAKAGSTAIKFALINAEIGKWIDISEVRRVHFREFSPLLNPMQVGDLRKLIDDGFFVFCFVRNPYARLLSAYLDKIVRDKPEAKAIKHRLGLDPDRRHEISFADFVSVVEQQSVSAMHAHWRVQYYQTFHPKMPYSFYGRLENFEHDFRHVCDRIGVDFDKYYRAEFGRGHRQAASDKLAEYYTPELKEIVATKFKVDFDHFGYPP